MIPQLDLHGTRHADVQRKCDIFMTKYWGSYECVDIITGHSNQMKKMVENALSDYGVHIKESLGNSAILRVYL